MNKHFKLVAAFLFFALNAKTQSSFSFSLGSEISLAKLYDNSTFGAVTRVDRFNKRPVLVLSAEYQKYLGKKLGLAVSTQVTSNYKLKIEHWGFISYEYFQFRFARLLLQGRYKPIRNLEIGLGPCLNYNYKPYLLYLSQKFENTDIRPQLELAGGCSISWVKNHYILTLQGIYGTDWLIDAPASNYYLRPLRTLSLSAAYRIYR